jgi:hypothetical protein
MFSSDTRQCVWKERQRNIMVNLYSPLKAWLSVLLLFGCDLPTAPKSAHRATGTANLATAGTLRRRAVDPNHRLSPPCSTPAPLRSAAPQERLPGYLFWYRPGTESRLVTTELASRYEFTPLFVYTVAPAFAAVVSDQALAAIRCDSRVESVEYNVNVYVSGRRVRR